MKFPVSSGSFISPCLLAINITGTSAVPYHWKRSHVQGDDEWEIRPHLYGHKGNFTGSCTDVKFDDNQCVLSARCLDLSGKEAPESKLNLNKCVYYSKPMPPDAPITWTGKAPYFDEFEYNVKANKIEEFLDQRFRYVK